MQLFKKTLSVCALGMIGALSMVSTVSAQVAGSTTTVGVTVIEAKQIALGWSVKKSILGKAIYNDTGEKIGKVQDLIIAPDKSVSYLIVAVGGFVGIGQHDVSIPSTQVMEQGGKLVLPGATKDVIKALPPFDYASDTVKRDQYLAMADLDLTKAREKVVDMQKKSAIATGEAKAKLDQQLIVLQQDLKFSEDKLSDMRRAEARRWKEFEAEVNKAIARMKRSMDNMVA